MEPGVIISDFKAIRHKRTQDQITAYLREKINSGNFKPGMRLPPTPELAAQWETHAATIHAAMKPLVKEGLLMRTPRVGTFVRKREEQLTCVGIYHTQGNWTAGSSDFERAVHLAIADELRRLGIDVRVYIDPRPESQHDMLWSELQRTTESREIQGLINFGAKDWPDKLPVFSVHYAAATMPNTVTFNLRQMAEVSLRSLAQQGCRSVGIICPMPVTPANPDGTRHMTVDFLEYCTDLARDLGFRVKNEWIRIGSVGIAPQGMMRQEQFGYEEFLKLWDQTERPEGLLVYPDTTAQGVILGLQEKRVRVPEELKLVFHKNEACDYLCPLPATFVISSEREMARAFIGQLQEQFRGEPCRPIRLPFRLVTN